MSKETQTKDLYSVWKEYTENSYSYFEKTIPQFHQTVSDYYQELIEIWKNIACSSVDIQKSFATKMGLRSSIPEAAIKMANEIEEQTKSVIDAQNKISIATIKSAKDSLHTLNSSTTEFNNLNKNIVQMLPSIIQTRS